MNPLSRFFLSGREVLVVTAAITFVALTSIAAFLLVDRRVEATLSARQAAIVDSELRYLQLVDTEEGRQALVRAVARRVSLGDDDLPLHALIDPKGDYLAGDVDWPPDTIADGHWRPIKTNKRESGEVVAGFGRAVALGDGAKVLVGRDSTGQRAVQAALGQAIIIALLVLLTVAAALIVLLNRRELARIDAIVTTAQRIIAGNLHERIPVSGRNDEFERLGGILNTMLERNQAHIDQMRIVTEAIAHDLRMPLQRVKTDLEHAQASTDSAARDQAFARADGEIDGALGTFNALLEITRAETGIGAEGFDTVDLAKVAGDVVELFEPVAEDKRQTLTLDVAPAFVRGQGTLLRQAVGNLIENAIKFSPSGATITVQLRQDEQAARLSVSDTGPGIPEGERVIALRPFGRLSRDAGRDGKGLGLALVAACAKLHGGKLTLEDAQPGLRAVLELPRT
jgi:signal transduction histidine kinase